MKMTIVATNVNKTSASFDAANWMTTKSFTAKMTSSSTAKSATSSINIVVVPCEITEATITTMQTAIGNTVSYIHPVFTYTNAESTVAICGAIVYELVGTSSYLSYNTSSRELTLSP